MTKGGLGRCKFPRLALTESPLSFCRPRPTRRRVWNDRDGSFTLSFQHVNVFLSEGTLAASFSLICWFGCRGLASARVRFSPGGKIYNIYKSYNLDKGD